MLRLKIARFLPFFIIIFFSIMLLINNLIDRKDKVYISLNTTTDSINILGGNTLERYKNTEVHSVVHKKL